MENMTDIMAAKILSILESAAFEKSYNQGIIEQWIAGDIPRENKEEVLEHIKELFKI